VTVERYFVRKFCRKLKMMGFSWTLCFSDEATLHMNGIVDRHNCRYWLVSHLMKVSNIRGTQQNLTCGVASLDLFSLSGSNCGKTSISRLVGTIQSRMERCHILETLSISFYVNAFCARVFEEAISDHAQ
jgi:hypothetical protein